MKTSTQIKREGKQLYRLCLIDGLLDETRARQVVQRVIAAHQRGYVAMLSHFQRLVRLYREAHTANIETAVQLPADLQATVVNHLANTYGPGIKTQFALKPALIGGMRIKVGSDVFDGSVQSELAALEKNFEITAVNGRATVS
jgi:F-type H+-transporting ATPase subunit delta